MERYLLLGLLQGITEFLPVSSSAHLVFAQALLGLDPPGVVLEGALHLGTLFAVLLYFRRDIFSLFGRAIRGDPAGLRYLGLLAVATFPIALGGLLLREPIERAFSSTGVAGGLLIVTGALLIVAGGKLNRGTARSLDLPRAAAIGGAQALALLPGISRSGATIAVGVILGLGIGEAVRFSFLLAIPAIAGGGLFSLLGAGNAGLDAGEAWGIAGATALASGLLAIRFLLAALDRGKLWAFGLYCLVAGTSALIFLR
ncbi:MAG: undecaprenyl-diphosphate phosphatase [Caldiserica bacterium]|nr:undecaprenyl-diphosphate phosphatase [Caldisericota bacterium]